MFTLYSKAAYKIQTLQ